VRITSEVMVTRSLERLGTRLQQYERTQNQLSSGKRILAASDDPAGARRAASLRGAMQAREQELRNAGDATGWLDIADSQLQSAMSRLNRVNELTVAAANTLDAGARRAYAAEVRSIAEELTGIANATHLGRPLFGGFGAGPAVEQVAGAWVANGTDDQVTRRVTDSEQVRINVTAGEWLGFGSPDGDTLSLLHRLADDLEAGAPVAPYLDQLGAARAHVGDALGAVGAATNRVVSATRRTEDLLLTLRRELSEIEDVDIAQGIVELQVQQVAYEATLQALGRALPPSLVAFLR
jgi:flagellar hook-associated protein 3 FlgL